MEPVAIMHAALTRNTVFVEEGNEGHGLLRPIALWLWRERGRGEGERGERERGKEGGKQKQEDTKKGIKRGAEISTWTTFGQLFSSISLHSDISVSYRFPTRQCCHPRSRTRSAQSWEREGGRVERSERGEERRGEEREREREREERRGERMNTTVSITMRSSIFFHLPFPPSLFASTLSAFSLSFSVLTHCWTLSTALHECGNAIRAVGRGKLHPTHRLPRDSPRPRWLGEREREKEREREREREGEREMNYKEWNYYKPFALVTAISSLFPPLSSLSTYFLFLFPSSSPFLFSFFHSTPPFLSLSFLSSLSLLSYYYHGGRGGR